MKSKAIIPLALGLAVGLVAVKLAVNAIRSAQGNQQAAPEIEVVVATMDIAPTDAITAETVVVKKTVPNALLPADAFQRVEDVVGRVTIKTIPKGMPISPSLLAPEGALPGIQIPEGYRAVSVKIDEVTGVAYQLRPGTFVDVLVVMDVKAGRKRETMSKVILQNVQVAAVGQVRGETSDDGGSKRAKSVTLLVPSEDVPKLHLAQTKGKITLAMRGGDDETMASTDKTALERELFGIRPDETEPVAGSKPETPVASGAGNIPSLIEDLMGREDKPAQMPSFTTTVINGPLGQNAAGQVLRVTYASANSREVIEVGNGRTTGDTASMEFGSGEPDRATRRRNLFSDRDRDLRRRGARGAASNRDDGSAENFVEIGE